MDACWTAVSLSHSDPRINAAKRTGSESRADDRGLGRSNASQVGERAWHIAMRWKASSGAELHSLQVTEDGEREGGRKRQESDSSPPQLNSNLILEMFFVEMLGKPRVTCQWGYGFPKRAGR